MLPDAFTLRTILSLIAVGALLGVGWTLAQMALAWPANKVSGAALLILVVLLLVLVFGI